MQAFTGIGAASTIISGVIRFVPFVGAIIGTLLSFFGGGPDLSAITKAINDLANKTAQALDQINRFAWSIGKLALNGLFFIARIVGDMIGNLAKAVRGIWDALQKVYKDVIQPALRALKNIRKILDDVYRKWLRPIINAIQIMRRFLAIFRAFGFRWAAALDTRLAQIEGRIIGPFLWITRQLNGYGAWINVILTAGGVFQRGPFLNSVYQNIGQITNLWWISQANQLGTAPAISPATPVITPTPAQVQGDFHVWAQSGVGPYAQDAATAQSVFQTSLLGL